jgi:ABC-type transport system substrate-binding protein
VVSATGSTAGVSTITTSYVSSLQDMISLIFGSDNSLVALLAFPPVGSNFGFYEDEQTDALIEQASAAATQDEAAKLWAEADHQVMEDAAFYPITEPRTPNYHAEQVNGAVYIPSFQNFDPANVWLATGKQGG